VSDGWFDVGDGGGGTDGRWLDGLEGKVAVVVAIVLGDYVKVGLVVDGEQDSDCAALLRNHVCPI